MLENIRYKLIELIAGKMPVIMNITVNGKGIKKGWSFYGSDVRSICFMWK
jgi:hypothetical protein